MVPCLQRAFGLLVWAVTHVSSQGGALPAGPIILGYQTKCGGSGEGDPSRIIAEVEHGVNVIVWFSTNLARDDSTGKLFVQGGLNYSCVAEVRNAIKAKGLPTAHLICIGGWNAPHPDTSANGTEWFSIWDSWNRALPLPFDGFDWDLEGHDNPKAPSNVFSPEVLQIMVDMSVAAKAAGLTVTMVPPQSYLDVSTGEFNRSLLGAYPDWHPDFHYHGQNAYAYALAAAPAQTFDLVTLQLYETWSRADQAVLQKGLAPEKYLQDLAAQLITGWTVNFSDPVLPVRGEQKVKVDSAQLVVAVSFGDKAGKSVFFWPSAAGLAYRAAEENLRPRGYGFWNMDLDPAFANGTSTRVDFARGFNEFLGVRRHVPLQDDSLILV